METTTCFVLKMLMLLCSVIVVLATASDDQQTQAAVDCSDGKVRRLCNKNVQEYLADIF